MEAAIQRFSHRLLHPLPLVSNSTRIHISKRPSFHPTFVSQRSYVRRAGWLLGIGEKKQKQMLPEIVKAGDPVLHEPAQEVKAEEIGSDRVQKIIDDMVKVMRMAPGVGLAAPQIGIPLQDIIARYHRMQGTPALWHSGKKYAGIATKTRSIHNARAEHSVEPANGISSTVNEISRLLSDYRNPSHDLESSLAQFSTVISTNLVEQVLKRCKNLGFSAHRFFNWTKTLPDFQPSFKSYHILIDVLGSSKQFPFLWDFLIEIRDSGCCEICPKIFWIIFWSYSRANLPNDAVRAFNRMVEFGVEPSSNDLDQLLYALCKRKHVKEAKLYFDQVKLEIDPSVKTYSILIRGLGDINDCENARKLFEEMIERGLLVDVPAYNSLFAAMCKGGEMGEAYKLFSEMGPKRLEPDACTYATFICAFCEANDLHSAFRMLDRMKRYELIPNAYTYNYVIKKLCAESKVDEAYQLMAEMMETGVNPDIWSYKTILAYHCDHSEVNKALKLVSLMEKGNCVADRNTYNMVLKLLIRVGRFDRMEVLWQHMGDGGFYPSVSTYSVMVHGLCRKKGKLEDACKYFEMMIDEGIPPYHNTVEMLRNKLMGFGLLNIVQILSDKMERSTSCTILELASVMRGKKVHSQRRPEETEWESDSDS